MTVKLTWLPAAFLLFLSSCSKQMSEPASLSSEPADEFTTAAVPALTADRGWYGFYAGPGVYAPSDTLFAPNIIKGGFIQMPVYTYDNRDVFTGIDYDILPGHNISGDSIIYEVQVKNPKDGIHSDWDVAINIKGTTGEAYVGFVADSSYSQFTQFFVGKSSVNGAPQLVYDFENFTTLRLILKNNRATIELNGKSLLGFVYGAPNRIGQIKNINFGGKGYLSATSVKLLNSYTNKLLLSETFNTNGKSTVVYH